MCHMHCTELVADDDVVPLIAKELVTTTLNGTLFANNAFIVGTLALAAHHQATRDTTRLE